jgi:hypothetical protein
MLITPQILHHGAVYVGEAYFYFFVKYGDEVQGLALLSLYSPPNEHLLQHSHTTLVVCKYRGDRALIVVDIKSILSVVAMVPFPFLIDCEGGQFFMIEKIGLDVAESGDIGDDE